jgi:hypothetical protein
MRLILSFLKFLISLSILVSLCNKNDKEIKIDNKIERIESNDEDIKKLGR